MISQKIEKLKEIKTCLEVLNTSETNGVAQIRELLKNVNKALQQSICGKEITLTEINNFQTAKQMLLNNSNLPMSETVLSIESSFRVFQIGSDNKILGAQNDTSIVNLDLLEKNPKTKTPPERGTFIQQLWKVGFLGEDGTPGGGGTGYMIVTDSSDLNFSSAFTSQHSSPLIDAPERSCEDLGTFGNDLLDRIVSARDNLSIDGVRDVSDVMNTFHKPGLTSRQLRDIDIKNDPYIKSMGISDDNLNRLVVNKGNKVELTTIAEELGFYVTKGSDPVIGPYPNSNYSDVKKFRLSDGTVVISSMPIICWGAESRGIPLRDISLPSNKNNRKDDGTNYICDLGGRDPAIRDGTPNPLPAHRFYGNGPFGFDAESVKSEGALERYKGGKCLGINNTLEDATFTTIHRKDTGEINITLKPRTAMWKIERATFNLEPNSNGEVVHPYYTVFGASRPPPAGFMGVPFVPKLNLLGRGTPVVASGITAANGKSIVIDVELNPDLLFSLDDSANKTGTALFVKQNSTGALGLDNTNVANDIQGIDSALRGLNSGLAGHGMNPIDLLLWLEKNNKHFTKGIDYLTIPAKSGTLSDGIWINPLDVLIPAGKIIPKITEAVATLWQFANGKLVPDAGPNRFQPGMVPFLPGVPAYTPQWHITFGFFNCGKVECDGSSFDVKNIAKDNSPGSWHKSGAAVSLMGPPPSTDSIVPGYNPSNPTNFDPHQMRCMTKGNNCPDFINSLPNTHGHDGEISLSQRIDLRNTNNMYFTEAPPGAILGWKTFLIVNCPLPMTVTYKITETTKVSVPDITPPESQVDCPSCKCDRDATALFINGDEQTDAWLIDGSQANSSVNNTNNRILKFKVGDIIQIRSVSGISHGVSLRFDHQTSSKIPTSNLENDQKATLKEMLDNNLIELGSIVPDEGLQFIAASSDVIDEMGGIPITFPTQTNDIIADFKIGIGAKDKSGKVVCTVHGTAMKFAFEVCSE